MFPSLEDRLDLQEEEEKVVERAVELTEWEMASDCTGYWSTTEERSSRLLAV